MLVKETLEQFGYDPYTLPPGSNKPVLYECSVCGTACQTRRNRYWLNRRCHPCGARSTIEKNRHPTAGTEALKRAREAYASSGITTFGQPLVGDRDWKAYHRTRMNRRYQEDPVYRIRCKLRAAFHRCLDGSRTAILPYTVVEALRHLEGRLSYWDNKCPLCGKDISTAYTIDHKIPLSEAKTEAEVIALFDLSNLDVLCRGCNSSKNNRRIRY